jgi:serine/threonine protein kinase
MENILVNKEDNGKITLKIGDFGVAKTEEKFYQTVCGFVLFLLLLLRMTYIYIYILNINNDGCC